MHRIYMILVTDIGCFRKQLQPDLCNGHRVCSVWSRNLFFYI